MLIIRSTSGVTPKDRLREPVSLGPYQYCPVQYFDGDIRIRYSGVLTYAFAISKGPLVTKTYQLGKIREEPFHSWKEVLHDYPLKEDYLHDFHHEDIKGDLTIIPKGMDRLPVADHEVTVEETWPAVARVGQLVTLDSQKPRLTLPSNATGTKSAKLIILPGETVHAAQRWYTGSPQTENYIFSDWGSRYLGSGADLGWQIKRDVHVYVLVYHTIKGKGQVLTNLDYCFIDQYPGLPTYHRWNRASIVLNGFYSINDEDAMSLYLDRIPAPGSFEAKSDWSSKLLTYGLDSDLWASAPSYSVDSLRSRYITDDVLTTAKYLVAGATQEALLAEKLLDINSLMYIRDFTEVKKLYDSYLQLFHNGINPKSLSSAFLATWYGVRLTVKDTKKIVNAARHLRNLVRDTYDYSYGRKITTCQNGVRLKANVSIAYSQYDSKWMRFLNALSALDFVPTPSRIWDFIPYSFVADWFVPIGDSLEWIDALNRLMLVRNHRTCESVEAVMKLPGSNFCNYPDNLDVYGLVEYSDYTRLYKPDPDIPLPWLPLDEIGGSWNTMRFLSAGALIVQRS
jgi:hypothetical protein